MDMLDHYHLTADEAMEMERFLMICDINNGVIAQSADEIEDEAAEFIDRASDDDDDGQDDVDDEEDDDLAYQFDPEFGYPTVGTVMVFDMLAQHLDVDFETFLHRLVHGEEAYGDGDGGALVVPASDAAVAGLEKQAFHTTAEGCGCGDDSECGVTGCAICLEEFEDGEEVTVMPCSRDHEFHPGCITKWLGLRNTCPLCRHALPTDVDVGP